MAPSLLVTTLLNWIIWTGNQIGFDLDYLIEDTSEVFIISSKFPKNDKIFKKMVIEKVPRLYWFDFFKHIKYQNSIYKEVFVTHGNYIIYKINSLSSKFILTDYNVEAMSFKHIKTTMYLARYRRISVCIKMSMQPVGLHTHKCIIDHAFS